VYLASIVLLMLISPAVSVAAEALLAPGAALADEKVDCTDPQTQMDMNICSDKDYKAADAALNAAYEKASAEAR